MKLYDGFCSYCGKRNEGLLLEETGGWMECIRPSASMRFT